MAFSIRYKSFFLGIIVTSITWAVIMYLHTRITDKSHFLHSERTVKWKLRPRLNNLHRIAALSSSHEKYIIRQKESSYNPFPNKLSIDKEQNLISSNEIDDDIYGSQKTVMTTFGSVKLLNITDLLHLGVIRSPEDQKIKDEGYKRHAFNLLISNRLGYSRPIHDTRPHKCRDKQYPSDLPSTSVIICFYNEALSTLQRTVYSILERTPPSILREVVLVDDQSDSVDFKKLMLSLKKYYPKLKLIHTPKRSGLIRARMHGAQHAVGEVLVFLDSHCEANQGWLEPLLDRIKKNRTTVVCPIIDIISADTFEYTSSPIVRGGFNWGLHFKWDTIPPSQLKSKKDFIKPIASPTMAGGLFAIEKQYFHELGEYDKGMEIWGGENLEISFRIWMCGGRLEIIPCSRVGHVFRRRRPYGSPTGEDTLTYNSLRVAHVWMDEYKEYYFQVRPDVRNKLYGNVSERIELRKNLGCKSFEWYMKSIYPELTLPEVKQDVGLKKKNYIKSKNWYPELKRNRPQVLYYYQIQVADTDLCIESDDDVTTKGSLLVLRKCAFIKRQLWSETEKHDLRLADLLCLDAGEQFPRLAKCHEMGASQDWRHVGMKNTPLYNTAAGLCLGSKAVKSSEHVTMAICSLKESRSWNLILKRSS